MADALASRKAKHAKLFPEQMRLENEVARASAEANHVRGQLEQVRAEAEEVDEAEAIASVAVSQLRLEIEQTKAQKSVHPSYAMQDPDTVDGTDKSTNRLPQG